MESVCVRALVEMFHIQSRVSGERKEACAQGANFKRVPNVHRNDLIIRKHYTAISYENIPNHNGTTVFVHTTII